MDLKSPIMIALYVIVGLFAAAFIYMMVFRQMPEVPQKKEKEKDEEQKPLYPQTSNIEGYNIEPQPQMVNVSNDLLDTTLREVENGLQ